MSASVRRQAEEIFQEAVDLPRAQRDALIEERCRDRPDVAAEVRALLNLFENDSGTFLDKPAYQPDDSAAALPSEIGPYHIVRVIGEGGMGIVCEATQDNPHRVVALKLIRPGTASASAVRRFRREADVLAQLQHPGVAHIYDAGSTRITLPDGLVIEQSYFAMELINGHPLTQYCESQHLSVPQRLDLIARVADAVQYAHQRGIVHRDLKPANIYVDQSGQPKVLDFGVARILDAEMTLATTQTAAGQIIGTLPYMSPEQVVGDTRLIDTRCDVYSLGVVLYELLTGRLPLDLRDRPIAEAMRIIREEEPRRLTAVNPQLRGDVATIVAKALEKEPGRRYGSAGELAADIRRYLRDEPIQARPATATYLLRKFARRHRALVTGAAIATFALIGGAVLAGWWAVVAESKTAEALRQQERAERLAYRGHLAAASAALESHDTVLARTHLESAPSTLRGWEWRHFWSRLDQSLLTISDITAGKTVWAEFTRDDRQIRHLFAATDGWRVANWDAFTGAKTHDYSASDLADAPEQEANRLACWRDSDGSFTLTDRDTGERHIMHSEEWGIPSSAIYYSFRCCPNRRRFGLVLMEAAKAPIAVATIIDLDADKRWQRNIKFFDFPAIAMADGGGVALAASEDGNPAIWNLEADRLIPLVGHVDGAPAIAFSPDERRLLTGARDATLRTWDAQTGAPLKIGRGHRDTIRFATFAPDGSHIVSCGVDRTVRLWDAESLELRATYGGHVLDPLSLSYSHDSSRVLTTGLDGTVRLWDGRGVDPFVLRQHTSYVYAIAVSPSGDCFVTGGWDGQLIIWNTADQRVLARLDPQAGNIHVIAFVADGKYIAATTDQQQLIVWRRSDFVEMARTPIGSFWSLPSTPAGEFLLDCDLSRGTATLWDPATNRTRECPLSEVSRSAGRFASATGRFLAYCSPHANVHMIDLEHGAKDLWQTKIGWTIPLAFSPRTAPTDRFAASIDEEPRAVGVWDVASGKQLAVLRGHTDEVYAVAWSPDGKRIATGGRDQVIRIWDAERYEEVARLQGHRSYVKALAFSPDGETLYSAGGDHTVRIWGTLPFKGSGTFSALDVAK